MYILGKNVDKIERVDIERLVQNQVSENKSLDYKRELSIDSDKDKKEFLFDITSLYNSEGGCLIYGIEEAKDQDGQNTGIPEKVVGLSLSNIDKLFQKIEDVVRSNTEPSINSLALKEIDIEGELILIIGVPKGLGLPSMVTFKQTNKFYRRRNTGKYNVDVYELNQMFMQNQVLKERAEHFRQARIDKVISQKVFPNLNTTGSFFIHIVPFTFLNDNLIDFSQAQNMSLTTIMKPMYTSGWDHMHNLDGFATFSTSYDRQEIDGYDQIMRNGVYEVYTSRLFEQVDNHGKKVNCMYGSTFIPETLEKVENGLTILKKFKIETPLIIFISIHKIKGGAIKGDRGYSRTFMTDDIFLPPVILPTYDANLYETLKPNFDILWQAVGFPNSPIYRKN